MLYFKWRDILGRCVNLVFSFYMDVGVSKKENIFRHATLIWGERSNIMKIDRVCTFPL